ncbi:hypothetical protein K437DRAFT_119409 [Tilletiaria anomala UBC 951]|uniref:Uncharacterized protein n=1 Tax=Tilletiaria anomala (strain ATCC 24038 / CBS 436.72 / UBC 951) TaxID=1037660 RepID=A0A066W3V4_TILAU|nr:uncharacterized protein K437DRAFT_119409 [Tilletiaria anomala UBC 951]KDN45764.1 hypothetical protein K437DRAFT_119409 [Tilletiaria anomala UBC 951]
MQVAEAQFWALVSYVAGISETCWAIASLHIFAHLGTVLLVSSLHNVIWQTCAFGKCNQCRCMIIGRNLLSACTHHPQAERLQGVSHSLGWYCTLMTTHIFLRPAMWRIAPDEKKTAQEERQQHAANTGQSAGSRVGEEAEEQGTMNEDWFKRLSIAVTNGINDGPNPLPIITAVRQERP